MKTSFLMLSGFFLSLATFCLVSNVYINEDGGPFPNKHFGKTQNDNTDINNLDSAVLSGMTDTPLGNEMLRKLAPTVTTPPTITCPPNPAPIEGCSATDVQQISDLPYSPTETAITEEAFKAEGGTVGKPNRLITYQDVATSEPLSSIVRLITRTFTAVDPFGRTASCTQTFSIQNNLIHCPPDLNVPGTGTDDITSGGFTALPFSTTAVAVPLIIFNAEGGDFNNCSPQWSITYRDSSSDTCPMVVTRTWAVRDLGRNVATCTQTINIVDNEAPTAVCQDISVQLDGSGMGTANITPEQVDNGSFDNCGIANLSLDRSNFTAADLGPNSVALNATDTNGNTSTCMATVTVESSVPTVPSVAGFVLVDADNDVDLFPITPDMVIDVNTLARNLNIRAEATSDVESVELVLSGTESHSRTENTAPYALYGDDPSIGDYFPHVFALGNYSLTATPYTGDNLSGIQGAGLTVNFEFTNTCNSLDLFVVEEIHPTSCGGNDGSIEVAAPTANPPVTFTWSHDPDLSGPVATGLSAGTYTIEVLDDLGCTDTVEVTLSEPELPRVNLDHFNEILDTDPAFELTGGSPIGGTYSGLGVSDGMFDPQAVGVGSYIITYSYTDENGCSNSDSVEIFVVSSSLSITGFVLVDADTNLDIMPIMDQDTINLATLPTQNLNIRADVTGDVESVLFSAIVPTPGEISRTENVPPYALFGDHPAGDYFPHVFNEGRHLLQAIPYSGNDRTGPRGATNHIDFEMINDAQPAAKQVNTMRVYPNPASTQATVSFEEPIEIKTIKVFDMMGRLVRNYEPFEVKNGQGHFLDLSSLQPGTYFIKTIDMNGFKFQKQMVITN